jgi:zinc metalloprotease ZmpB
MEPTQLQNEYGETIFIDAPELPSSDGALAAPATAQQVADAFVQSNLAKMGLGAGATDDTNLTGSSSVGIKFTNEKAVAESRVVTYQQTVGDLEVFEAVMGMVVDPSTMSLESVQSSVHANVVIENPGALTAMSKKERELTNAALKKTLGVDIKGLTGGRVTRQVVYRYEPGLRQVHLSGEGCFTGTPAVPTLPATTIQGLEKGQHYVVNEVLFDAPLHEGEPAVHWRALIEPSSGDVLYLRPLVACANGLVYDRDPQTQTGAAVNASSPAAVLNGFRSTQPLADMSPTTPQPLKGVYVEIKDVAVPVDAPPVGAGPATTFSFDVPTDDFSAVNAYYNCERLFRTMIDFGFNVSAYFNNTTFPVPVDHRALNDQVNAMAPGNVAGNGMGSLLFGRMMVGSDVGIVTDNRVVWHEFGHSLLWDSVSSPNFGFAHSAGDALGAVLNDPGSRAVDRFQTFPWVQAGAPGLDRRHDRDVAAGWGWFGARWNTQYGGEQVLSTTLFRFYRSIGGDSSDLNTQRRAASTTAFLIMKAIGSMTSTTSFPNVYEALLEKADLSTLDFKGIPGGALHKVIRWAFEKQGLFQPNAVPGSPNPVAQVGNPPAVDVFIDDGRSGEYHVPPDFNHWSCQDMWVRRSADGGLTHQEPVVGRRNYMYVRVKSRGTQQAFNVRVDGYHANPGTGLSFPDHWQAMDTPTVAASGPIAPGAATIVGPFPFVPLAVGHECLLAIAHADGDLGNDTTIRGSIPEHRLVPFDNNIAQRNVCPVFPTLAEILKYFREHIIWIRNPYRRPMKGRIALTLPKVMQRYGWELKVVGLAERYELGPKAEHKVTIVLEAGQSIPAHEFKKAVANGDNRIEVRTYLNSELSGGMTYLLVYQPGNDLNDEAVDSMGPGVVLDRTNSSELDVGSDSAATLDDLPQIITQRTGALADKRIRTIRMEIEFEEPRGASLN